MPYFVNCCFKRYKFSKRFLHLKIVIFVKPVHVFKWGMCVVNDDVYMCSKKGTLKKSTAKKGEKDTKLDICFLVLVIN